MNDLAERRLLAAIVVTALRDIQSGRPARVHDALAYINGPNLDADCDWLNIDPAAVRAHAKELIMPKRILTESDTIALHERYMTEKLSIEALARETGMAPATLSRAFAMAGLPLRPRRRPQRPPTTVRELNRLITAIAAVPGVTGIRVTFDMVISPENHQ